MQVLVRLVGNSEFNDHIETSDDTSDLLVANVIDKLHGLAQSACFHTDYW
jgi:hypothetical protein